MLKKTGWDAKDVDLWEVNEAFAAVTMAAMHEFKLPHDMVNVHGGAVALGHPIGACGARIVVTLLGALRKTARRGASRRCASAAAKRRRWRSRWSERLPTQVVRTPRPRPNLRDSSRMHDV